MKYPDLYQNSFFQPPPNGDWGQVAKVVRNYMTCEDPTQKVMFTYIHPLRVRQVPKTFFARNWMKFKIYTAEVIFPNPPCHMIRGGSQFPHPKGIEWNVQVCIKHHVYTPSLHGVVVEVEGQLSTICFVSNCMTCADLYRQVMLSTPTSRR